MTAVCNLPRQQRAVSEAEFTASHFPFPVSHLKIEPTVKVSPPLLVEEAGERLTADLLGEVIFPPQDIVPVLLVVPLAGRDVRTLRDRKVR